LERRGVKTYVTEQRSFDDLLASITALGELTGAQDRARQVVAGLRARMDRVAAEVAKTPVEKRPKVFIEIAADPIFTAGKGSYLDELVTKAGGVNAVKLDQQFAQIGSETVVQQNPDAILVCYMSVVENPAKAISQRLGWATVKAVKEGRIIADIHPDLLCRPGPRLVDGLEKVHAALYKTAGQP
jgi:iron complex transport system substrate-binding protein